MRFLDAARRRGRAVWADLRQGPRRPAAELAFDWLCHAVRSVDAAALTPAERRAAAETLYRFGEHALAARLLEGRPTPEAETPKPLATASMRRRAIDRALRRFRRTQRADGSWPDPAGNGARPGSIRQACEFLCAQEAQIASAVEDEPLREIDESDGRWLAVADWASAAPAPRRIVEVGCGAGRYLRRLAARVRRASLIGLDPSRRALGPSAPGVAVVCGGWPRLPLASGACDAAFAVEALEHAMLPRRAVAEMCRVVRPGGRVLIIDKHADWQRLSECRPWERWFRPEEVAAWLAASCRDVEARPIAHGPHAQPTGLFWCWTGVRR